MSRNRTTVRPTSLSQASRQEYARRQLENDHDSWKRSAVDTAFRLSGKAPPRRETSLNRHYEALLGVAPIKNTYRPGITPRQYDFMRKMGIIDENESISIPVIDYQDPTTNEMYESAPTWLKESFDSRRKDPFSPKSHQPRGQPVLKGSSAPKQPYIYPHVRPPTLSSTQGYGNAPDWLRKAIPPRPPQAPFQRRFLPDPEPLLTQPFPVVPSRMRQYDHLNQYRPDYPQDQDATILSYEQSEEQTDIVSPSPCAIPNPLNGNSTKERYRLPGPSAAPTRGILRTNQRRDIYPTKTEVNGSNPHPLWSSSSSGRNAHHRSSDEEQYGPPSIAQHRVRFRPSPQEFYSPSQTSSQSQISGVQSWRPSQPPTPTHDFSQQRSMSDVIVNSELSSGFERDGTQDVQRSSTWLNAGPGGGTPYRSRPNGYGQAQEPDRHDGWAREPQQQIPWSANNDDPFYRSGPQPAEDEYQMAEPHGGIFEENDDVGMHSSNDRGPHNTTTSPDPYPADQHLHDQPDSSPIPSTKDGVPSSLAKIYYEMMESRGKKRKKTDGTSQRKHRKTDAGSVVVQQLEAMVASDGTDELDLLRPNIEPEYDWSIPDTRQDDRRGDGSYETSEGDSDAGVSSATLEGDTSATRVAARKRKSPPMYKPTPPFIPPAEPSPSSYHPSDSEDYDSDSSDSSESGDDQYQDENAYEYEYEDQGIHDELSRSPSPTSGLGEEEDSPPHPATIDNRPVKPVSAYAAPLTLPPRPKAKGKENRAHPDKAKCKISRKPQLVASKQKKKKRIVNVYSSQSTDGGNNMEDIDMFSEEELEDGQDQNHNEESQVQVQVEADQQEETRPQIQPTEKEKNRKITQVMPNLNSVESTLQNKTKIPYQDKPISTCQANRKLSPIREEDEDQCQDQQEEMQVDNNDRQQEHGVIANTDEAGMGMDEEFFSKDGGELEFRIWRDEY